MFPLVSTHCAAQLLKKGGYGAGGGADLIFISFLSFGMTSVHSDQHLYINAVSRVITSGALRGNVNRDAGRQDSGA